jgi:hypothetical protein
MDVKELKLKAEREHWEVVAFQEVIRAGMR